MKEDEAELMAKVMQISIDYSKEVAQNKLLKSENDWLRSIIDKYIKDNCSFEYPPNPNHTP